MGFISHGVYGLVVVPIMTLLRRHQDFIDTVIRDVVLFLAPIVATIAVVLLWFFGW
jgi:hypothetical protein